MKKQGQNNDTMQDQIQEDQTVHMEDTGVQVWKEKYIRALADYQNLEKRTREEQKETQLFASLVVVEKLLPIVDLLEKAHDHLKDMGLELALKELTVFFRSIGVNKIDVIGKSFDPYTMDCVEIAEGADDNSVVSLLSPGYTMHGKIIRPAKVKVGKNIKEKEVESIKKE